MPTASVGHPYFDIFAASLVPFMLHGPDHTQDPPTPHVLYLLNGSAEGQHFLGLLLGADRALRDNHARVAAINLDLAEIRLRLLISHEGLTPALEAVLSSLRLAKEELAAGQLRRAMSALCGAFHAVPGKTQAGLHA